MTSTNQTVVSRITVGVLGGTGYTGQELLRLLDHHEGVQVTFATSRSQAGTPSPVEGIDFVSPGSAPTDEVDLIFLCLPHGESAAWVEGFPGGPRIIDLTADHRPGSGLEARAVYGLAEWNRGEIAEARMVANPGCYPTGMLTSLLPLVEAGLVDEQRLTTVNAASGVTGAGRTPRTDLLFAEVSGNFRAYGEGNRHRHLKEVRALLPDIQLFFQPHLLPVPRGILETIVVPVKGGAKAGDVRTAWRESYSGSKVVRILEDRLPDLSDVVWSDRIALGVCEVEGVHPSVVTVVAALDNLGKGAAGQAVQNMNLMHGWPIDRGVRC